MPAPWVMVTQGGNLFYTATLEDAVETLRQLGYRSVKQGPAGALYKASASAKLKAILSRLQDKS